MSDVTVRSTDIGTALSTAAVTAAAQISPAFLYIVDMMLFLVVRRYSTNDGMAAIIPVNGPCDQIDQRMSHRGHSRAATADELKKLRRQRGGPFTADAINRLVKTIGGRAKLPFGVHAYMLRHACGYALANAGHDTRLIQEDVIAAAAPRAQRRRDCTST